MKRHERTAAKVCTKCGEGKPLTEYYTANRKGVDRVVYHGCCKTCSKLASKAARLKRLDHYREKARSWKAANPERNREITRDWQEQNREHISAYNKGQYDAEPDRGRQRSKSWRAANPGRHEEAQKRWVELNPERRRAGKRKNHAKRRAIKISALCGWASERAMQRKYDEAVALTSTTGIKHQVDHIVPLVNSRVCGLHCEDNLQVITASANARKSNTFAEDIVLTSRKGKRFS